ncbi:hypothetical protein O181_056275 [Austropuccinia psidii MF-1]|uniref:Uncharacterized protein n=1 Tax=Austropuccinia psidii MF-1 TaxID=1389203 RepID=A0A9Q3ECD7_9BASI|nr:hypothetical protein [Austropuccinia psidii MF-1]
MWKDTVLNTISYVYKVHNPIILYFLKKITNHDKLSFLLISSQTIDDSTRQPIRNYNTTSSLFASLQRQCNCSAQLDKLEITNQLLKILKKTEHRNTSAWIHSLQETYAKFMSWKISFSEFFGLLVQANIHIPEALNQNNFGILLHQHLNQQDTKPAFETVYEAIQAAETDSTVVINPEIIDLDASASAMRYFPPEILLANL